MTTPHARPIAIVHYFAGRRLTGALDAIIAWPGAPRPTFDERRDRSLKRVFPPEQVDNDQHV
jgi:hypothetical protein